MKYSKMVSILLVVTLIFGSALACGVSVSAESVCAIYSDTSIVAKAGDSISIPVYLSGNSGLMGYDMSFTYDESVLTAVSVTRGNIMTDGFFEDDIEGSTSTSDSFRVFYSHAYQSTENGVLFYLNFNVDSKAIGLTTVKVDYDNSSTYNGDFDDVTLNCSDFNISIANSEYSDSPVISLNANDIFAGEQLDIDIDFEKIGSMSAVTLTLPYDNSNFQYLGFTENGIEATVNNLNSEIEVTVNRFTDKTDGKKLTLQFKSESFATSGKYNFVVDYNNLDGVERVIAKGTEVNVNATYESDSIVIYTDDVVVNSFGDKQLIVPLYIKHNSGLLGYKLTFDYDPTVLEAVSAKSSSAFTGSFSTNIGKSEGEFTCLWFGNDDVLANGEFITLTFNVVSDKESSGEINISYNEKDIISESKDGVKIQIPTISYKVNDRSISSISVKQSPNKTIYFIGESLDITGLEIIVTYSDGRTEIKSSGFKISGFDSDSVGTKIVTVTYGGKTTTIKVMVLDRLLKGDVDGDGNISIQDATTIQMYIAELPIFCNIEVADVEGDDVVSIIDATLVQLYLAGFENDYHIGEQIK